MQAIRDGRSAQRVDSAMGHVRVSARREGDGAAIVVDDDGPGVPTEARMRIFDPYFTTKADGTGLGLAIVKKIVVEAGGRIDVEQSEELGERGSSFTCRGRDRPRSWRRERRGGGRLRAARSWTKRRQRREVAQANRALLP